MAEILELKIESVSPKAEGYTDYEDFRDSHYIGDSNVGIEICSKLQLLTNNSNILSSVGFKPSDENATYHRITFEDGNYINELKELIEAASGWDICSISIITSDVFDTKLGGGEVIDMHTWR